MASSFRMFRKLTVVLYVCIPLITITTLYTFWFHPNRPPRYSDLALRPLLGSSEPLPVSEFSSLRHLCDETDWTEGLWLQCHSNVGPSKTSMRGGLSNLENRMQTCVRLAIAAGAGVILPTFATRDNSNLLQYPNEECPDALFDTKHYQQALSTSCPQLNFRACKDTEGLSTTIDAKFRKYLDPSHSNGTFRALIDDTISKSGVITRAEISSQRPLRVLYGDPFLSWNYTAAAETDVKKDLFRTLKYNNRLSELGYEVSKVLRLRSNGTVVGIHLRGEDDWPGGFGTLDTQIDLYTQALLDLRNSTVDSNGAPTIRDLYVSCGNPVAIQQFQARIEPLGYTVHDKMGLLSDNTDILGEIEALQFDGRAVTEYESLVSADYFIGIMTSSLSAAVAYARTMEEENDYFGKYIHPSTTRGEFVERVFPDSPSMRGNERTKLMVLTGADIMDCFP